MKELTLSNTIKTALVDDDIYNKVIHLGPWRLHSRGYVMAGQSPNQMLLHHQVFPPTQGAEIDHINGNKLDNTRLNLRYATHSQNLANRTLQINNICGYKGVRQKGKKWQARITLEKTSINIGHFDTIEESARAYNKKALELFGDFAVLNKI